MELRPVPAKQVVTETLDMHLRIPRCRCLGYDRFGREYWLMGVQESAPLVPLGRTLQSMPTADPAVLVREKNWWGFHSGRFLDTMLTSFKDEIPCERRLRINMSERLNFARRKLYSTTLRFKPSQKEWLAAVVRGEVNIANYKPASGPEGAKALEVLWGRCCEVRGFVQYSEMHKSDEFPSSEAEQSARAARDATLRRQKRLRDQLMPVSFDLHPALGWFHVGPVTHLRNLYGSTTATRLIADPTIYRHFQDVMKRNQYRQQHVTSADQCYGPTPSSPAEAASYDNLLEGMDIDREGESLEFQNDDLEARTSSDSRSYNRGLRPVEQLHIVTQEVLRIHKTGRDAAKFLNVSQSGISLCLTGTKPDAYGFKWRYYEGPKIDCKFRFRAHSCRCVIMLLSYS
jgi:hypothetical protein